MGGIQGYQAGSTFKAFTACRGTGSKGIPLSKKFNAKPSDDFSGKTFETCDGREATLYGPSGRRQELHRRSTARRWT